MLLNKQLPDPRRQLETPMSHLRFIGSEGFHARMIHARERDRANKTDDSDTHLVRRTAWILFLLCVAVYGATPRYLGTADTFPNVFLPVSLILHGDLALERYPTLPGIGDEPPPYYVQRRAGH